MKMYYCQAFIKIQNDSILDLLRDVIELLDFKPFRMDIFYNEFKKSKVRIPYNVEYIEKNISESEVDGGITSISFYDESSSFENTTPFFKFSINDTTLNEELVSCTLEWVAYRNLDWLLKDEFVLKNLLRRDSVELVYLIAYNQNDVYTETQEAKGKIGFSSKILGKKNWGKEEIVNGISFIAAPIMYFGKGYDKVISINELETYEKSKKIKINGSEIIKIEISPLYANTKDYRKEQEHYWKKMQLSKQIELYRELTKIDFTEFLKKRSTLKK